MKPRKPLRRLAGSAPGDQQEKSPEIDETSFQKEDAGDVKELQQAEEALRQADAEMERRVEERTAHLKQANEKLLGEIEERRQIEDRLRESEARFLAFMQHLPGGAVIRDLQGRYLFANKAWENAFAKKWQGKALEEIWPVDTARHLRDLDQQAIVTGDTSETLVTLQQEDGPHAWLINCFPILKDGQPIMVGSAGIDVTRRRQAEEALEAERQRLFSLLDELPNYVYLHGPDHTVRFANRVFREHFGEPNGRLCYEILRGCSQPCGNCSTERVLTAQSPQESQWTSQSGRIYQIYSYPFTDVDGSLLVLKVGLDITERLKAEEALYQEKERYRLLVEESPLGIVIVGPKGEILYLNPRFVEIFGYTREDSPTVQDWIARSCPDPHYRQEVISAWNRDSRESRPGEAKSRTFAVVCKDGTEKVINFKMVSLENRSRMVLCEDVTECHRTQEALIESERRFGQLVEHAADELVLHDNGRIIEVNQQTCDDLGYTREELLKMTVFDLEVGISPQDLQKIWEQKTESPFTVQGIHRRKDGSTFPVEVRVARFMYGGRRLLLALARDITERLEAEEALRQSQIKYRRLVVAAPFGISIIGKNGRYKYLNPKFEKMFGYTLDDIPTGREWFPKAFPDSSYREMVVSDWKEEFKQPQVGEVRPRTFRVTCKDGTVKVIDFRSVALVTGDWLIFYEDISKRVQAEEALVKSEEQYRLLVNQIPAVVFKGYADGRVEFFDRKIESLTGYKTEDFDTAQLLWKDLVLHEDVPVFKEALLKALRGNGSYVREYRIRKQDGGNLWIQGRGQIFCNVPGQIDYISGVLFDISERKRVEKALEESEALYRLLAENISDVLWTTDMNLNLTYVSPSTKLLTGFSPREVILWGLEAILTPVSLEMARRVFAEEMRAELQEPKDLSRARIFELELIQKAGSIVWTEVKASFLRDEQGRPVGVLGVSRDISKRKQAELALRRREAILEAVSFAAEKFLQTESWENDIQNILGRLGQSADASRVYIFENHLNMAGEILTSQRYEWAAPGINPQINNPGLQNISWQQAGFSRWEEHLSIGQMIVGRIREFPPAEQELLGSQKIKSIVAVPIFVGQQWWGMIGFNECLNEREWSPAELEALKTAASTLGAAILRERAEQSLRKSEQKLRSLAAQLLTAQENERKRLAAELHDELGHALLTLKLSIRSLEKQLLPEHTSFSQDFRKIDHFIVETIKEVRRLYHDLSPGDLEDLGLTAALRDMIEDVAALQEEVKWSVRLDNLDGLFPLPVQTAIYRVVQEALTNIGKHARPKNVSIIANRESHRIVITIEDDGEGFEATKVLDAKKSLGLLTMEERLKILGGTFSLWSQKKRGTRISFTVPLPEGGLG
jgi:PAS domain S-box-containing protein